MAKSAEKKSDEDGEIKVPRRSKKLLLILAVFLLMILGAGGYTGAAYYFNWPPFEVPEPSVEELAAQKAAQEAKEAEMNRELYVKFNAPFAFNLLYSGRPHSASADLVLVVSGTKNEELAKKHLDLLSSTALTVLSEQSYEELLSPSGRERLRMKLLDTLRSKMTEIAKTPVVDQVLYSDFVMQ